MAITRSYNPVQGLGGLMAGPNPAPAGISPQTMALIASLEERRGQREQQLRQLQMQQEEGRLAREEGRRSFEEMARQARTRESMQQRAFDEQLRRLERENAKTERKDLAARRGNAMQMADKVLDKHGEIMRDPNVSPEDAEVATLDTIRKLKTIEEINDVTGYLTPLYPQVGGKRRIKKDPEATSAFIERLMATPRNEWPRQLRFMPPGVDAVKVREALLSEQEEGGKLQKEGLGYGELEKLAPDKIAQRISEVERGRARIAETLKEETPGMAAHLGGRLKRGLRKTTHPALGPFGVVAKPVAFGLEKLLLNEKDELTDKYMPWNLEVD